jgi:TRAP-type mannitol/chloroaromatic compound transport system permease small subunit
LTGLARLLDAFAIRIGVALAWLGIPLMILLAALQPVARWIGWTSEIPFAEAATAAFLAVVMTSFGYAYAAGAHVRLDVLSHRFPARLNAALELAGTLLILIPLCALIVTDGTDATWRALRLGERWAETSLPVQWAVRAWVPLGFLLLMLAALASALRALVGLLRR